MVTILFVLIIGLVIGYFWGKEAQREKSYREDPDNDPALTDNQRTLLLFTKEQRYKLGRTMTLGNKQEVQRAKEELERQISHVSENAFKAKMEEVKG